MRLLTAAACVLSGSAALAQSAPAPLSPDNAATHIVRAAGMSLRDGDLPPGALTVRVVRGGFTGNVQGQLVTVQVTGGATLSATTGADGRAQFPHLPVGGQAQAWTELDGERLLSDAFDIPAEAGLRVLLATGGDATAGGVASAPVPAFQTTAAAAPTATNPAPSAAPSVGSASTGIVLIRLALALTTVFCFGMFVFTRRYRVVRRSSADEGRGGHPA